MCLNSESVGRGNRANGSTTVNSQRPNKRVNQPTTKQTNEFTTATKSKIGAKMRKCAQAKNGVNTHSRWIVECCCQHKWEIQPSTPSFILWHFAASHLAHWYHQLTDTAVRLSYFCMVLLLLLLLLLLVLTGVDVILLFAVHNNTSLTVLSCKWIATHTQTHRKVLATRCGKALHCFNRSLKLK